MASDDEEPNTRDLHCEGLDGRSQLVVAQHIADHVSPGRESGARNDGADRDSWRRAERPPGKAAVTPCLLGAVVFRVDRRNHVAACRTGARSVSSIDAVIALSKAWVLASPRLHPARSSTILRNPERFGRYEP
ncbi:hypothetical protein [Methylobacterium aquaticum]|uniref:hypothetical protein n=1 Tax=Methylobacterium aquaticum TaxID=270351 RepID=UPI0019333D8B|nr:hypothetical protein [Methylobacterium aquaticum]QRE73274.1 hypothetical protein F1D61_06140 [Methylobacterium aquaticum]